MKKTLIKLTRAAFAYGIGILMLLALVIAVCYAAALIVGMPTSESIHAFLSAYVLPYMYIANIVVCLLGLVNMYLRGEHVFLMEVKKK